MILSTWVQEGGGGGTKKGVRCVEKVFYGKFSRGGGERGFARFFLLLLQEIWGLLPPPTRRRKGEGWLLASWFTCCGLNGSGGCVG